MIRVRRPLGLRPAILQCLLGAVSLLLWSRPVSRRLWKVVHGRRASQCGWQTSHPDGSTIVDEPKIWIQVSATFVLQS